MNGKMIRKGVKIKKGGVLLALALSVSVLFGNGITAEAAEIELVDGSSLYEGQELHGGDVIFVTSSSSVSFAVEIDGSQEMYDFMPNPTYTLSSGVNYIVAEYHYGRVLEGRYYYVYLTSIPLPSTGDTGSNNDSGGSGNNSNIPVQPEEETTNQPSSYYQSDAHTHSFSWVIVQEAGVGQDGLEEYRCACGLVEGRNTIPGSQAVVSQFKDMIVSAPAGEKISFDSGRFYTMSDSIIQKLAQRNDVSAEITFEYKGKSYKMTIPAGADYTAILGDEENFYGYFYFAQLVGATIEEI